MGKRRGVGRRHMITSGDEPARRRPLAVWRRSVAASVLLVAVLPTACGDTKDASVCTAFAEWVEARAEINGIDPTSRSTADEIEAVERYLASVHRLRQAGEGRHAQQIEDLEVAVTDALLTLRSVPDDADHSTWSPLLEDAIDTATEAADRVDQAIGPSCAAALQATALGATSKFPET